MAKISTVILPGSFEPANHFYPATLQSELHPLVGDFMKLDNKTIAARYAATNNIEQAELEELLSYKPKHFLWAGADIFKTTDIHGRKQMIVVETNSSPSGQKSMPYIHGRTVHNGFGTVMESTFKELVSHLDHTMGGLAVIFDKNILEASGYAATMADVMGEKVHLVEFSIDDQDPSVKWKDGVMYIKDESNAWLPIRACFRYVTQSPWDRIPIDSKTIVLNPIIACIGGGRNKAVAAIAYDNYNTHASPGLHIRIPHTQGDVSKLAIPALIREMGGHAVVKVPYSNAGQGVYTITNAAELEAFMMEPETYDKYIVQALVGRREWMSSPPPAGAFFHVGTRPNAEGKSHVFDIRFMVAGSPSGSGFKPVAIYARRARAPLKKTLQGSEDSWAMLGTNLSVHQNPSSKDHTAWSTETDRLVLMSKDSFESLGLDMDDLVDAYVQTALSVIAIDTMCQRLTSVPGQQAVLEEQLENQKQLFATNRPSMMHLATRRVQKVFNSELFKACTRDNVLFSQIMLGSGRA